MITTETARKMTDSALHYARRDLNEVIAIQEKGEREAPGTFLKLGAYHDERHAVLGEIGRRQKAVR